MGERLAQLGEAMDRRDLLEVALLAVAIFVLLRLLGRARGSGVVRGLGLLAFGVFLVAQLVIASLDLHELRKVLDYLLTTVVVGLIVIFDPDLAGVGMRHRAALGRRGGTGAVLLVVSEEAGRISLAVGGKLDPVPREQLAERLGLLLGRAA